MVVVGPEREQIVSSIPHMMTRQAKEPGLTTRNAFQIERSRNPQPSLDVSNDPALSAADRARAVSAAGL